MKLLSSFASNAKTSKLGTELKIHGAILYMEPSATICPAASPGCMAACLKSAGRMHMSDAVTARQRRTQFFEQDLFGFLAQLYDEIERLEIVANRKDYRCVVRLNGTSDIDWIALGIFDAFPSVTFYDYTKRPELAIKALGIENYSVTFSRSEVNDRLVKRLMDRQVNVAVVFEEVPKYFRGLEVIDGDTYDFRFLDKQGVVVGLTAKGKAKKDNSGFTILKESETNKLKLVA